MGIGETGVGEAPGQAGSFHGMPAGIPLKKKMFPKASPKKLTSNKNWTKSFNKFASKKTGIGGKRGA